MVVNGTADKSGGVADFPATDPNVVAVGGTSLVLKSNDTRATETVWNDNGPDDLNYLEARVGGGAGGGGCSKRYTAPAWQSHYSGYSAAGCGGKRLDADVAAIADPETGFDVLDTYSQKSNGGWVTVGGTSLASPVVAAMWALAGGSGGPAYPASTCTSTAPSGLYPAGGTLLVKGFVGVGPHGHPVRSIPPPVPNKPDLPDRVCWLLNEVLHADRTA